MSIRCSDPVELTQRAVRRGLSLRPRESLSPSPVPLFQPFSPLPHRPVVSFPLLVLLVLSCFLASPPPPPRPVLFPPLVLIALSCFLASPRPPVPYIQKIHWVQRLRGLVLTSCAECDVTNLCCASFLLRRWAWAWPTSGWEVCWVGGGSLNTTA